MDRAGYRRLSRRAFLGGTAGLAATALLAACGANPTPTQGPTGGTGATTTTGTTTMTTTAAGTATGGTAAAPAQVKGTVRVGIVTSRSGALQSYGEQYLEGFEVGLDYVTRGTGVVAGYRVETTIRDDTGAPDPAVAAAKDLIGQGYKILMGSVVSGVALQVAPLAEQNKVLFISGPAAVDTLTGINPYTFRSGRQTYQDILTAKSFLADPRGKSVLVFAPDTAFGQGNVASVKGVFGADGGNVDQLLVPADARDFAPFAQQVLNRKPDLLFVAWAGATATAMWSALDGQGVLTSFPVVTGLDQRASYSLFGPAAERISFLSHYIYQAPQNEVNAALVERMRARGNKVPDLFTPDGFVGAQLLARAIEAGDGTNVDRMVSGLEGYSFKGPKGDYTVRKEDHGLVQPMFQVKLARQGDAFEATPVTTVAPDRVAPPVKRS
ncbi:MAG: substrate-binding domain-containing protein [Chloroflexota bacterium]|nr:substrate-binding domain-containing protein [Chloroflexota bacterium]